MTISKCYSRRIRAGLRVEGDKQDSQKGLRHKSRACRVNYDSRGVVILARIEVGRKTRRPGKK